MTNMHRHRSNVLSFVVGCVALSAACSQGPSRLSPAGPSTVLPDSGNGFSGWTASSTASSGRGFVVSEARGRKTVSGVGTVAHLRGECEPEEGQEYLSFVVQGVKVVTDENTAYFISPDSETIQGCGNLRNGTKVLVVAGEELNDDFSYTAESITIVDQPGGKPPQPVEGEGVVAALKGVCDSLTMVIHGYPVMTTTATDFTPDCESIKPGTRVRVTGVLGGNSVVADTVEVLESADDEP